MLRSPMTWLISLFALLLLSLLPACGGSTVNPQAAATPTTAAPSAPTAVAVQPTTAPESPPTSIPTTAPTPTFTPSVSLSPTPRGARVRLDPVLYTYWISGPEILEFASKVNATDMATGKQTLLFTAPETTSFMRARNVASSAWSPAGESVLVSFTNSNSTGGSLRLVAADGNVTMPLLEQFSAFEYALWSPDGQRIVMRQDRPQACLMIANLYDGKLRELGCNALEYPRFWSTDGRWVAVYRFSGARTTEGNWFAVAVDGGKRVALDQMQPMEWYDQRYHPWRVTGKFACTWRTDPQAAKQFSFWRCE